MDASAYTQVRHVEIIYLDDLATAMLAPALLATVGVLAAIARSRDATFWWTAVALTLLATILLTTVAVNLPINTNQLDWTVDAPPVDWATVRDRWRLAHIIRTAAAVTAFGLLICATFKREAGWLGKSIIRQVRKHPVVDTCPYDRGAGTR